MALTLLEAAKLNSGDVYRQGVIEQFAMSSGVLRHLPIVPISGGAMKFARENTLPQPGFRGVNENYKESTGTIDPMTESLTMFGMNLDVDRFILQTHGTEQRAQQEAMGLKSLALSWERCFFKGFQETNPVEFNGLQARLSGSQLIPAGSTKGGDPLSLAKLDEVIDQVSNPTHIFMNAKMRRLMTQASRNSEIAGFLANDRNEFGMITDYYQGLPIVVISNDSTDAPILAFNEVAPVPHDTLHTSASIYVVSLLDGMLNGIDNGGIMITDLGLQNTVYRTTIDWYSSIALFHGKCAARLYGVKDSPVTA